MNAKKLNFNYFNRKFDNFIQNESLRIFLIAFVFFLLNQFFEFIFILILGASYSENCEWDCIWYANIVENGYDVEPHIGFHPGTYEVYDKANWAFFPFFPLIAKTLHFLLNVSAAGSVVLVSKILFLMSIFMFMKMMKIYSPNLSIFASGAAVAFQPYAIYGNVGYTESAFLFFTSYFFYNLKLRRPIAIGLSGAILSSVRFVGIFALLAYITTFIFKKNRLKLNCYDLIIGILLIPLGASVFMFYLYWLTGDAFAFSHVQRGWNRIPQNPFLFIKWGFQFNALTAYWSLLSLSALLSVVYFAIKKRYDFVVFSLFCTIVPLSTGLWAMPRYIFWQVPILFLIAHLLNPHKTRFFFICIFTSIQFVMYRGWFNGSWWVV